VEDGGGGIWYLKVACPVIGCIACIGGLAQFGVHSIKASACEPLCSRISAKQLQQETGRVHDEHAAPFL